ncbi:E3 ubiquitin-protein ligase TRIM71-like [Saccostrea echinata]|uniref:E3 ubiquitin-protein ligase TRIM71-like n=1 Tax=Saccostrea echinata TaxID=191078 RepID=UPI002A7EDF1D|nr:E3 ubiquitin-protein ligase TRIM71-like [Saccostrea echinata]
MMQKEEEEEQGLSEIYVTAQTEAEGQLWTPKFTASTLNESTFVNRSTEEDMERGSDVVDITVKAGHVPEKESISELSASLTDSASDFEVSLEYPEAQFALTCSVCDSPSELFCEVCKVRICKLCVTEHLKNKSRKHNVVAYDERSGNKPYCHKHQNTESTYSCNKCAVCICDDCTNTSHVLHDKVLIEELLERQTTKLMQNSIELKSVVKPAYLQKIENIKMKLSNAVKMYDAIDKDISICGEKLHREVDFAIESLRSEARKFKDDHLTELEHEILVLETRLKDVEEALKRSEDILLSPGELLEYCPNMKPLKTMPEMANFEMPIFTPGQAHITKSGVGQLSSLIKSACPSVEIKRKTPKKSKKLKRKATLEVSVAVGERYVYDVTCASESSVWMCGAGLIYYDNNVRLIEKDGNNTETLECPMNPKYIALKSPGCVLFSDHTDNTVKLWSREVQMVFIKTEDWTPKGLVVTLSSDVIVCQYKKTEAAAALSRVVRYDEKGSEIRKMEFDREKRIFRNAVFVAENRNFDICVSDEDKHSVVVMDKLGKLQFVYKGNIKTGKYQSFNPRGISTDSQCNILVSDYLNYTIHVIDQHGSFLSYLLRKEVKFPMGLSVDKNDKVWVGEYSNGTISVIEYLA